MCHISIPNEVLVFCPFVGSLLVVHAHFILANDRARCLLIVFAVGLGELFLQQECFCREEIDSTFFFSVLSVTYLSPCLLDHTKNKIQKFMDKVHLFIGKCS